MSVDLPRDDASAPAGPSTGVTPPASNRGRRQRAANATHQRRGGSGRGGVGATAAVPEQSAHPRNKGILCSLFAAAKPCPFTSCPYAHISADLELPLPTAMCRFHRTKACLRDGCTMFHGSQQQLNELNASGASSYRPVAVLVRRDPLEPLTEVEFANVVRENRLDSAPVMPIAPPLARRGAAPTVQLRSAPPPPAAAGSAAVVGDTSGPAGEPVLAIRLGAVPRSPAVVVPCQTLSQPPFAQRGAALPVVGQRHSPFHAGTGATPTQAGATGPPAGYQQQSSPPGSPFSLLGAPEGVAPPGFQSGSAVPLPVPPQGRKSHVFPAPETAPEAASPGGHAPAFHQPCGMVATPSGAHPPPPPPGQPAVGAGAGGGAPLPWVMLAPAPQFASRGEVSVASDSVTSARTGPSAGTPAFGNSSSGAPPPAASVGGSAGTAPAIRAAAEDSGDRLLAGHAEHRGQLATRPAGPATTGPGAAATATVSPSSLALPITLWPAEAWRYPPDGLSRPPPPPPPPPSTAAGSVPPTQSQPVLRVPTSFPRPAAAGPGCAAQGPGLVPPAVATHPGPLAPHPSAVSPAWPPTPQKPVDDPAARHGIHIGAAVPVAGQEPRVGLPSEAAGQLQMACRGGGPAGLDVRGILANAALAAERLNTAGAAGPGLGATRPQQ